MRDQNDDRIRLRIVLNSVNFRLNAKNAQINKLLEQLQSRMMEREKLEKLWYKAHESLEELQKST